jgi:tRNA-dihydrouridine synthase
MRIGTIEIEKPLLLAPMEDVTDQAFRIVCKQLGVHVVHHTMLNL